jgi:hypothetical protein
MAHEVRLEQLFGSRVFDGDGRCVGHIEEVVARRDGRALVVVEFRLGEHGWLRRVARGAMAHALLDLVPFVRQRVYRVPWNRLDLSDPARPRLDGPPDDLAVAA